MAKYGPVQITKELSDTALGLRYCGNALYVARDFPGLSLDQQYVLSRWMDGSQTSGDRLALQDIAIKISMSVEE